MKKMTVFAVAIVVLGAASSAFAGGPLPTPDSGSSALLLGAAFGGLGIARKFFRR
jgi:hypothetical protein